MFEIAVLMVTLFSLVLASIPLIGNPKSQDAKKLFIFISMGIVWSLVSVVASMYKENSLIIFRLSFVAAIFMSYQFLNYVLSIQSLYEKNKNILFIAGSLVFTVLAMSNFNVESIHIVENSSPSYVVAERGALYLPVVLWILVQFLYAYRVLYRQKKVEKRVRTIKFINGLLTSITLGLLMGLFTNVVLPLINQNSYSSNFAFLSVMFWAISFWITLSKSKIYNRQVVLMRMFAVGLFILISLLLFYVINQLLTVKNEISIVIFLTINAILWLSIGQKLYETYLNLLKVNYKYPNLIQFIHNEWLKSASFNDFVASIEKVVTRKIGLRYMRLVVINNDTAVVYPNGKKLNSSDRNKLCSLDANNDTDSVFLGNKFEFISSFRSNQMSHGHLIAGGRKKGEALLYKDYEFLKILTSELSLFIEQDYANKLINEHNKQLKDKVDDATAKLRNSNNKLLEIDKNKDEFISMASHQLRTPLTTVKNYLLFMKNEKLGKLTTKQTHAVEVSYSSVNQMVATIDEMLDAARIANGTFNLELTKVTLSSLLYSEIEKHRPAANAKNIRINFKPKHMGSLKCDSLKVTEVLSNFLDNAIRYGGNNTSVDIALERGNEGFVKCTVTDHGIGIKKSDQKQLFNKFYRGSNAKKIRPDGTGLGLYVAKKIIEAHGGKLIFTSKINKGSTFGFELPKTPC